MIFCASLRLALLVVGAARSDSVPESFAGRVRADVAARWSVDSAQVQLKWGEIGALAALVDDVPFHLSGRGTDGWLIVVVTPAHGAPQAIRVRAGVMRNVPVAAHALRAGQRLAPRDIEIRRDVVWSAAPLDTIYTMAGWEVRRDTPSGMQLSAATLVAPRVIAAGDPVVFVWSNHGVRIERTALAMTPARLGELVQGQVGTTRLTGQAVGPGRAQMRENLP